MTDWIITCNTAYYDVLGAFEKLDVIDWKQSVNIKQDDIIYIYVGKPVGEIKLKCKAVKVNKPEATIVDSEFILDGSTYENYGRYMELQDLERYSNNLLGYNYLKDNGLKSVQGPSKVNEELLEYIIKVTNATTDSFELYKDYSKDYVIKKIGVTIDQWRVLLHNQEVFLDKDIELIKRIYLSYNHATTCYQLGIEDEVSPSTYIKPVVELGKRISDKLNLNPIIRSDGREEWWCIPFWGRYCEDAHFEWKLRPKLAKALISIYPELELNEADGDEDDNLIEYLKKAKVNKVVAGYEYKGKPKKKKEAIYSNGRKCNPRDRQTALNALAHAKYECEINIEHPTFKRKKSDVNYTEPHHLIPMSNSYKFEVSLDVEENIVSLCSNCHNQVHYGEGAEELLKKLYDERKGYLEKVGIVLTFEEVLEMYRE